MMQKDTTGFEALLEKLETKTKEIRLGGGLNKIDSHHKKGKLTAWERISYLLDANKNYIEILSFG